MLSTVFNPCSNTFSGFHLDWNERGWIVMHQGNLTSDCQIFFLLTFEEITDVFFCLQQYAQVAQARYMSSFHVDLCIVT